MVEFLKEVVSGDVVVAFYKDDKSGVETASITQGGDSIEITKEQFDKLATAMANELR
jgi:hypothetical protein